MVGSATLTIVKSTTIIKNETASSEKARQRRTSPGTRVSATTTPLFAPDAWPRGPALPPQTAGPAPARSVTEVETARSWNWAVASAQFPDRAGSVCMTTVPGTGGRRWKDGLVSADLLTRARAGDGQAFGELVEPYRRELQVHCYRFLGSAQDAEDAVQETLLAAWRGLGGFEGRASVRTWLYQVATSRCLHALRSASRRPPMSSPDLGLPEPARAGAVAWLEPYPDVLLDGLADLAPGPEARYEAREAISLAFVTALQLLPPRQRAVLILRDVLGF